MRAQLAGVIPAVLLLAAAGCEQESSKPGLDGTWAGVSLMTHHGYRDDAFARTIRWTITGETSAISDQIMQEGVRGTIKVDDKSSPKMFDVQGKSGGTFSWSGIYELEGDTLKVCYVLSNVAHVRPKEFRAKPAYVLTLKRVAR
jgi:uncharacterized protein (TIGR03067 family)